MSKQIWAQVHHRYELINQIVADPAVLDRPLPSEITDEFGSREGVLRALHQRWVTLLEGCLDAEMENGTGDGLDDVRSAYAKAAGHSMDLYTTLHRQAADPVLRQLTEREYLRLATAAGLLRPGHHVGEAVQEVAAAVAVAASGAVRLIPRQRGWRELLPEMLFRRPQVAEA